MSHPWSPGLVHYWCKETRISIDALKSLCLRLRLFGLRLGYLGKKMMLELYLE